jgi:hypothetical protein
MMRKLGEMEGLSDEKVATYPGTLSIESADKVRSNIAEVTIDEVVKGLTDD